MKYTYCEKLIWFAMNKTIIDFFSKKHPNWNIKLLKKNAKKRYKEVIRDYAHQAYELADYIENTKKRVVNEMVAEATKRIEIEDVRPRTIEIYQNGTLEKTLDKELYH